MLLPHIGAPCFRHILHPRLLIVQDLADYENLLRTGNIEIGDTFEVVMSLPDKYKTVVYLYYYEGYKTPEISNILQKPQSTIRFLHP